MIIVSEGWFACNTCQANSTHPLQFLRSGFMMRMRLSNGDDHDDHDDLDNHDNGQDHGFTMMSNCKIMFNRHKLCHQKYLFRDDEGCM